MSRATVDEIIDRIKQLSAEDRLLLDELLAEEDDRGEIQSIVDQEEAGS